MLTSITRVEYIFGFIRNAQIFIHWMDKHKTRYFDCFFISLSQMCEVVSHISRHEGIFCHFHKFNFLPASNNEESSNQIINNIINNWYGGRTQKQENNWIYSQIAERLNI